ncbi:MAG: hypothetical protein JO134_14300 [Xanthobacteraceae bacterium]|nr:hypothetical protein [Xanthobacteraceae bacterium]
MRSHAIAIATAVGLSIGAAAAEPPNLVGDWTRSVLSSGQLGEHPGYPPATQPRLSNGPAQDWKMKIDKQDGNSFSGTLKGPAGRPQTIIGTFEDDKRFVFATNEDTGNGEVTGDELHYCWAVATPRFIGTGCATYKRNR